MPVAECAQMIDSLRNPACYPHPVSRVHVVETHISWVLLTGSYAYKIKKPVNLGFVNFSTLAARHHYCEEELRLNHRLAPEIYLGLVRIAGTPRSPAIGGAGPAIEYAVKMREFPQSALLDATVKRGEAGAALVEALADKLATFHATLLSGDSWRDARDVVLAPARDNFEQIRPLLGSAADLAALDAVRAWTLREYEAGAARFAKRQVAGYVRECHGDLHLGNIVCLEGASIPFDCIEFNPALRWMDVISEISFLAMDLEAHERRDLGYILLNRYLEASGDYQGVAVLPFYLVYRAVVRAKVHLIRASQKNITAGARKEALGEYQRYMSIATSYARSRRGAVFVMHGFSGAGKTTIAKTLLANLGAIRVRSDIERKRLQGLHALERATGAPRERIYDERSTTETYQQLMVHAQTICATGLPAIVDATCLKRAQRDAFHSVAQRLGAPFRIVNISLPIELLRARIAARRTQGSDASDATLEVLDMQLAACEPLAPDEILYTIDAATMEPSAVLQSAIDEIASSQPGAPHT